MRAAFLLVAVLAHHSHPVFYDQCTTLTVEGDVETVQWKNPHVLIDVKTAGGKIVIAEWTSSAILERTSVAPPKAGDHVVVRGNPMRDPEAIRKSFPGFSGAGDKAVVDLLQIRRASDGWNWSRSDPPTTGCQK